MASKEIDDDSDSSTESRSYRIFDSRHGITTTFSVILGLSYIIERVVIAGQANGLLPVLAVAYCATYFAEDAATLFPEKWKARTTKILASKLWSLLRAARQILMRVAAYGLTVYVAIQMTGYSLDLSYEHVILFSGATFVAYLSVYIFKSDYSTIKRTAAYSAVFVLTYELRLLAQFIWPNFP